MMEMYQTVPFLDAKPAFDWNKAGTTDSKTEKNGSFSDALEQELSQGEKIQSGEVQQKGEAHPEAGEETEAAVPEAGILWMLQNPLMQQTAAVHTAVAETVQISQKSQSQQVLTEASLSGPEGAAKEGQETSLKMQAGELIRTESELPEAMKGLQPQQEENKFTDALKVSSDSAAKTETNSPEMEAPDHALLKPGKAQTEQENAKDSKMPEPVQMDRTAASSRNVSFQTPERVQTASDVDMTDVKAGIQKLAESMNRQIAGGRTEFEIWLEPANLGKLAIKVAYEGGRAMISITCLNEKTMELISQNAKNLGNILEQHTGTDTVVIVDQPESDYLKQKSEQESQGSYSGEEQQKKQEEDSDEDSRSFLQQLRLGLM